MQKICLLAFDKNTVMASLVPYDLASSDEDESSEESPVEIGSSSEDETESNCIENDSAASSASSSVKRKHERKHDRETEHDVSEIRNY